MKAELLHKLKFVGKVFPMDLTLQFSPQKLILPYYHTVSASPRAHYSELGYYREENIFKNDLDFFQKNFESVPIDKLDYSKPSFHLTFDDGLKENFAVVASLLHQRNIHATFFINSDFIDNKKMFIRHKISLIISEIKNSDHNKLLVANFLQCDEKNIFEKINALKDEKIVEDVADLIKLDIENYLQTEQPYLSILDLKEMKKMGFKIGNHSSNHPRFSGIQFSAQKKEILKVNNFLNHEISEEEFYFSFPFGDDLVAPEFFKWMYSEGKVLKSFGTSGLKMDHFSNHFHRILMEWEGFDACEIIKSEYLYYFVKVFFNKNKIRR